MAFEADVFHAVAGHLELEMDAVAAERVVAVGVVSRTLQVAEVPRPLAVVEDHLLVELTQIRIARHDLPYPIILRTAARPSTKRSMSSRVL